MSSQPHPNNKPDGIKSVETTNIVRNLSTTIKKINCMIDWWVTNQSDISVDPTAAAKCGRIILQLKNYRNDVCDKFVILKHSMTHARESYKRGHESNEFKNAEMRVNEIHRELSRTLDAAGHYFQALVTRWFHENDCFTITDMEVKDNDNDFDVEIADEYGSKYCVEVWQGQSKSYYGMEESAWIIGFL